VRRLDQRTLKNACRLIKSFVAIARAKRRADLNLHYRIRLSAPSHTMINTAQSFSIGKCYGAVFPLTAAHILGNMLVFVPARLDSSSRNG
jgi:hypothetical protein